MITTIAPVKCREPDCPAVGYWQMTSRFLLCPRHHHLDREDDP